VSARSEQRARELFRQPQIEPEQTVEESKMDEDLIAIEADPSLQLLIEARNRANQAQPDSAPTPATNTGPAPVVVQLEMGLRAMSLAEIGAAVVSQLQPHLLDTLPVEELDRLIEERREILRRAQMEIQNLQSRRDSQPAHLEVLRAQIRALQQDLAGQ
jgi:hypothetical protein